MSVPNPAPQTLRVLSVVASVEAGGIGPVCRYAAEGMARQNGWQVTLLALNDPVSDFTDKTSGLRIICLGLDTNCARHFLEWLRAHPHELVITSDVTSIEPAYRFFPSTVRHIIQIHDSRRPYRDAAVRQAAFVDGVSCVGRHIEVPLRESLQAAGFHGLLRTVHNGANFPAAPQRSPNPGPLRLLFMGRMDALKGVFDFVPLLQRLQRLGVPVALNLVGGENETLRRQFESRGLARMVTWTGRVPHSRCYEIAAESDVLLMASRKEPFGMVTIEAMSMGCVPIAYDIPSGSTEIIEHGQSGLLVPLGDIRAWAEQIRILHEDRPKLAQLSAGAMTRARTHFSGEVVSRNTAAFLNDVMAHAEVHPAKRESGIPPETPSVYAKPTRGYHGLPEWLRDWIRNRIGARPRLAYWMLNR